MPQTAQPCGLCIGARRKGASPAFGMYEYITGLVGETSDPLFLPFGDGGTGEERGDGVAATRFAVPFAEADRTDRVGDGQFHAVLFA